MSHRIHRIWLKVTALIVGSFGPVFFFGTMQATSEPARLSLDILSWPIDNATSYAAPDTRFLSALTGGFLLGWGVTIWCLASWVHEKAPNPTRWSVLAGLVAWFILDSAGSLASGNASNVIFNVAVLAIAVGPLWWPASPEDSAPAAPAHERE